MDSNSDKETMKKDIEYQIYKEVDKEDEIKVVKIDKHFLDNFIVNHNKIKRRNKNE